MIDVFQPEAFPTFAAWLKAFCKKERGTQRRVAEAANVSPQAVTKWLQGGNIDADQLKLVANFSHIEYAKLRLLADGESPKTTTLAKLSTRTELGAICGRKWEQLHEPAQGQVLGLIETLLGLQSSRLLEYGKKQQELVHQREKPKKTEKT